MNRTQALAASLNGTAILVNGFARSTTQSPFIIFTNGRTQRAWAFDAQNESAEWRPEIARGTNVVAVQS